MLASVPAPETTEYTPKVGDIAFYDTDGDGKADYSGFIISTSGSNFTTLEGSVTENVRKTTYTTNNAKIVGYGVPDYAMLLLAKEDELKIANAVWCSNEEGYEISNDLNMEFAEGMKDKNILLSPKH